MTAPPALTPSLLNSQIKRQTRTNLDTPELRQLPRKTLLSDTSPTRLDAYGVPLSSGQKMAKKARATSKIGVVVRVKPGARDDCSEVISEGTMVLNENRKTLDGCSYQPVTHRFSFDRVYTSESTQQIFETEIRPLISSTMLCFAYGQTGSGKTFTLFNPVDGVCFQTVAALLEKHRTLQFSFYEIYRGVVYDLLAGRNRMMPCEDADGLVRLMGIKEIDVASIEEANAALSVALKERSTSATNANLVSSRSHAVFRIQRPDRTSLFFVDLAGSERGADRGESEAASGEGAEINKSLLALKECIRAMDLGLPHIPFRQSRLTQILREHFLAKDTQILMLATVNPSRTHLDHTLNTLRYATRLRELSTLPKRHDSPLQQKTPIREGAAKAAEHIHPVSTPTLSKTAHRKNPVPNEVIKRIKGLLSKLEAQTGALTDRDKAEVLIDNLEGLLEALK